MEHEPARIDPNPHIVALMDYALDQVLARIAHHSIYRGWQDWAVSWKAGERSPAKCVSIANYCFENKDQPRWAALGQLAWGAKESCYNTPSSGWLAVRYIADAMISFGVAFPNNSAQLVEPPTN